MSTEETKKVLTEESTEVADFAQELSDENLDEITGGVTLPNSKTVTCRHWGKTFKVPVNISSNDVCKTCELRLKQQKPIVLI